MGWNLLLVLFIVSLVGCCMGFKNYIWFLNVGYGGSVAVLGVAMIVMMCIGTLPFNVCSLHQCILFVGYGLRLSLFTLIRDLKNKNYQKVVGAEFGTEMKFVFRFIIWIYCGALYVAETSTAFFRLYNNSGATTLQWIGLVISIAAVITESTADKQKTEQKKENLNMVATKGLYKMCRCPNYFGEIMFWTGHFIGALDILKGGQWIMAAIAEVCIVFIMFNGAQRLEKRQNKRYGDKPEYWEYVNKTPIIIPLLPIYHLNKVEQPEK